MKKAIAVFAILVSLLSGGYYYWISTPEHALLSDKKSLEKKNRVQFEEHVDVNKIEDAFINELAANSKAESSRKNNIWGTIGVIFSEGAVHNLKPQIKKKVESEIKRYFKSDGSSSKKSFSKIQEHLKYKTYEKKNCSSSVCFFSIKFTDSTNRQEIPFLLKLEKVKGTWKIVELPKILEEIKKIKV